MGVADYVAGVDRLLTRAHELFPAGGGAGEVFASNDGKGSVPQPPSGNSGLGTGAGVAGGVYSQARSRLAGLDAQSAEAEAEASAIGAQGWSRSGLIRDQARAQAAAIAPMTNSAFGQRLLVSAMVAQVDAMQGQLDTTNAQNQVLATGLRQVAAGYADAPIPPGPHDDRPNVQDALPEDPKKSNDRWNQLTREEKDWLYSQDHDIGNHPGMPWDPPDDLGKDHYNRLRLTLMRRSAAALPWLPHWRAGSRDARRKGG